MCVNQGVGDCENATVVIVYMVYSNADSLSLRAYRSGTYAAKRRQLSTDGKQGSAYGIYHMHNSKLASMSFAIVYLVAL